MKQYIDKSEVIAEIERRTTNIKGYCLREGHDTRFDVVPEQLSLILAFIDTLEVKEVDFEKIWKEYFKYRGDVATVNVKSLAKHFFELGLKVRKGE